MLDSLETVKLALPLLEKVCTEVSFFPSSLISVSPSKDIKLLLRLLSPLGCRKDVGDPLVYT